MRMNKLIFDFAWMNISFAQITYIHYPSFLPPANKGKVMFSQVSVILFGSRGVVPRWDLGTYPPPPDIEPGYLPPPPGHGACAPTPLPIATDIWWSSLETCSNLFT